MLNIDPNENILNEKILRILEKYWEINLPKTYRDFLLKYNGGKCGPNHFIFKESLGGSSVRYFFGLVENNSMNLMEEIKTYHKRIPGNMFPMGNDHCSNLVLLSVKGPDRGKIYFWDHEQEADTDRGEAPNYSNLTLIADSFEEFIASLEEVKEA